MWKWKEKWVGKHLCIYMSDPSYWGFHGELSTARIELFILFFGISWEF